MYRTSPHHWWTRYHQLGRKIERQGSRPTATDVRMAAILMQTGRTMGANATSDSKIAQAVETMEWVIEYGRASFEQELAARKAEACVGTSAGR